MRGVAGTGLLRATIIIFLLCCLVLYAVLRSPTDVSGSGGGGGARKEKATLMMLVRNDQMYEALASVRQVEDRFNGRFAYTWTFLNNEPFVERFVSTSSAVASGRTQYGVIPQDTWSLPSFVSKEGAEKAIYDAIEESGAEGVTYEATMTYRHRSRFHAGLFYDHELMKGFEWYWRIEPGMLFSCDMRYDPFTFMRTNNKTYGFTQATFEMRETLPSLWNQTLTFLRGEPRALAVNNAWPFVTDDDATFHGCHFWTAFEVADLRFWRSPLYRRYFEHLDRSGGFYYDRWGDSPVHSLAACLFLPRSRLHLFEDVGYQHASYGRCPSDEALHTSGQCVCHMESENFDDTGLGCLERWARKSKGKN